MPLRGFAYAFELEAKMDQPWQRMPAAAKLHTNPPWGKFFYSAATAAMAKLAATGLPKVRAAVAGGRLFFLWCTKWARSC